MDRRNDVGQTFVDRQVLHELVEILSFANPTREIADWMVISNVDLRNPNTVSSHILLRRGYRFASGSRSCRC